MPQAPYWLDRDSRAAVLAALRGHCVHRGWSLLAAHVRTSPVHVIVEAEARPERVMNEFKSYASRELTSSEISPSRACRMMPHWAPSADTAPASESISEGLPGGAEGGAGGWGGVPPSCQIDRRAATTAARDDGDMRQLFYIGVRLWRGMLKEPIQQQPLLAGQFSNLGNSAGAFHTYRSSLTRQGFALISLRDMEVEEVRSQKPEWRERKRRAGG